MTICMILKVTQDNMETLAQGSSSMLDVAVKKQEAQKPPEMNSFLL